MMVLLQNKISGESKVDLARFTNYIEKMLKAYPEEQELQNFHLLQGQ